MARSQNGQQIVVGPGLSPGAALTMKQSELREQLRELATRRNQLLEQKSGATLAKTAELDARLSVIDTRTAQLEQQLFQTNDAINRGLSRTDQGTTEIPAADLAEAAARRAAKNATRDTAAITAVVMIAFYAIYRSASRALRGKRAPGSLTDNSAQLSQLQQSIDVIAVEVERISEAQRYTSKILSERGIAAGAAEPVAAQNRESSRVR